MTRDQIEKTYGRPLGAKRYTDWFPVGTKYHGKALEKARYAVKGGSLWVWYVDDRAKVLETTSPRYRTPSGLRVGLHIRGKRCPSVPGGACVGAFFYDDCTGLAIRSVANGKIDVNLQLAGREYDPRALVREGDRIQRIFFGEADVLLTCF
jgi:hypothetical protein